MGERGTPVLNGSKCTACGTVAYPASTMCPRCAKPTAAAAQLSTEGVVWAYTVQRFAPKSPPYVPPAEGFSPFAVGYVELPEGIKIEAILDCDDFAELDGAPVSLVATSPVPRFAIGNSPVAALAPENSPVAALAPENSPVASLAPENSPVASLAKETFTQQRAEQ